jgi:hypothetical protein
MKVRTPGVGGSPVNPWECCRAKRRKVGFHGSGRTLDRTRNVVVECSPRRRPLLAAAADRPESRVRNLQPTPRCGIASKFRW